MNSSSSSSTSTVCSSASSSSPAAIERRRVTREGPDFERPAGAAASGRSSPADGPECPEIIRGATARRLVSRSSSCSSSSSGFRKIVDVFFESVHLFLIKSVFVEGVRCGDLLRRVGFEREQAFAREFRDSPESRWPSRNYRRARPAAPGRASRPCSSRRPIREAFRGRFRCALRRSGESVGREERRGVADRTDENPMRQGLPTSGTIRSVSGVAQLIPPTRISPAQSSGSVSVSQSGVRVMPPIERTGTPPGRRIPHGVASRASRHNAAAKRWGEECRLPVGELVE